MFIDANYFISIIRNLEVDCFSLMNFAYLIFIPSFGSYIVNATKYCINCSLSFIYSVERFPFASVNLILFSCRNADDIILYDIFARSS